jgi:hypothetical protein
MRTLTTILVLTLGLGAAAACAEEAPAPSDTPAPAGRRPGFTIDLSAGAAGASSGKPRLTYGFGVLVVDVTTGVGPSIELGVFTRRAALGDPARLRDAWVADLRLGYVFR